MDVAEHEGKRQGVDPRPFCQRFDMHPLCSELFIIICGENIHVSVFLSIKFSPVVAVR